MMDQPIADRIGDAGFANGGVPRGGRELAGDQRRGPFTAIFQDFEQIPPLGVSERREQPIIDGEQIELGEFREQPAIGAVATTDGELVQKPRRADIRRGETVATRALHEGRREPRFSDAGRSGDQQMVAITDPAARTEAQNDLTTEPARRAEIDVFERRGIAQLRVAQALGEFPSFPSGPFAVDEQAEAVVKTQLGVLTRAALVLKRRGHRRQVQRVELLDRRVRQHTPPRNRPPRARSRAAVRVAQARARRAGADPAGG